MPRILHFGIGNFHRAHQAWYTQNAGGWSILGVSLRSAEVRDQLAPQGFDFTLVMQDANGRTDQRIDVIDNILVAPESPDAVLAHLADPVVKVVTITVTEKGYHLDQKGELEAAGSIAAEIAAKTPETLLGYLGFGIAHRQISGGGSLTVISCDNLSHNGDKLRGAVRAFAQAAGLEIDFAQLAFPNTMVDRITPRPTADLAAKVSVRVGWDDASPVVTETFSEWIIEDDFAGPRPDWARAGAVLVDDVAPYERRKLRMLNGAHSLLAYLGKLRGHSYVHEAVGDPTIHQHVHALMQASMRTLGGPTDAPEGYRDALIARFANPALAHSLGQIAMDGSQKMPIRCVEVLNELAKQDADTSPHCYALAAWVAFVLGAEALDDPKEQALLAAKNASDPVQEVLGSLGLKISDTDMEKVRVNVSDLIPAPPQ